MRLGLLILAALLTLRDPAAAQLGDDYFDPGPGTEIDGSTVHVTAGHADDRRLTTRPGPGPGRTIRCEFWEVLGGATDYVSPLPVSPVAGELYELRCFDDGASLAGYPLFLIYTPGGLPGPAVSTDEITAFAYSSMTFEQPIPAISPAAVQVIGVPTWLAVTSRLDYPEVSAAAGPVWASVRPVLRHVRFTMPDGGTVTCDRSSDMTHVWDPEGGADQTSDCTYTITSNGRGGADPARPVESEIVATITWDLHRRTNLDPTEHHWAVHTETTTIPITVRELQAVIN